MNSTGKNLASRLIADYLKQLNIPQMSDDDLRDHGNAYLVSRAWTFNNYIKSMLDDYVSWFETSKEHANFTYHLTKHNEHQLAGMVDVATECGIGVAQGYIDELTCDAALVEHINRATLASPQRNYADLNCGYGRRLGWYAMARAMKPRVVVETGVEKGMGSCILAAALLRNRAEGHLGRYYGTDINPEAGCLFTAPYSDVGQILYGDSMDSLSKMSEHIDLFINDSDHSVEYEAREYLAVHDKLSTDAIVLGDNSHASPALLEYASSHDKKFMFFAEKPRGHFYPGAGIGICFGRGRGR